MLASIAWAGGELSGGTRLKELSDLVPLDQLGVESDREPAPITVVG